MSAKHIERAKLLLLRKRLLLTDAPYVVINRLGGIYDDAFMLVLEAVQDGSLSAEKKPKVEWDLLNGYQEIFESIVVHSTSVATADLLKWLECIGGCDAMPPATDTEAPSPAPVMPAGASDGLPDPERRLALLRELGGNAKYSRCVWKFVGIGKLVESEKSEGRNRNDEKTIRADLREAAQAENDAKRAGFGSGLVQR